MHILLIKTSSMGDVIHALPALTDAMRAIPGVRFDWMVEEAFQEIPSWHPAVERVIPVALRRWRKNPLRAISSGEWAQFKRAVRAQKYDLVLDSQGLVKSAWLSRMAYGSRVGFDQKSAREPWAAHFYHRRYAVDLAQHAIARQRELFAQALGYEQPTTAPESSLTLQWVPQGEQPYVVFLHGTSWPSKEWPEAHWIELAHLAKASGYQVKLVWGNEAEHKRTEQISEATEAFVLPKQSLGEIAKVLAEASAVIGVDSGLAHLSAALGVPAITLYGATDPGKTGALGVRQKNLQGQADCVPCLKRNCEFKDSFGVQKCWKPVLPSAVFVGLQRQIT